MANYQKLTPRGEDYSKWYNELVVKADLAEQSAVRGCMVIKPYGYAIWEMIQAELDRRFKERGVKNAYFPLLIPKSFFSREAEHVEGFAKESAIVTHHRLMQDPNGKGVVVDPNSKLEEEMIIRPTSETIIWSTYKNWISSYRDLPILCNQWCNVMRWEMRTRLFLRTAEFLWQEGHTAHATSEEADDYARQMLEVYADFAQNVMAIPVVKGVKSPNERFDVQFLSKENKYEYVWATSWGVSTRLMGALIMTHSDDNGLVLPPHLAPIQVVIVPIFKKEEDLEKLLVKINPIADQLKALGIRVKVDTDDKYTPGYKFADYELKGVPVRLAMGGRDLENNTIEIARRDTQTKETVSLDGIVENVQALLEVIQKNLLQKALSFRIANTREVNSYDEFKEEIKKGGFILAHWDGTPETEQRIKDETKATIRCIPSEELPGHVNEPGVCMVTGKPSAGRVIFALNY